MLRKVNSKAILIEKIEGKILPYVICIYSPCYMVICQRPTMELLSWIVVMLEELGFNLCVAPFLNVCVPNVTQGVKGRECWRWSELGQRCHTIVML